MINNSTYTSNEQDSNECSTEHKLHRTEESGHNLDTPILFNNMDEYKAWFKEDEMYEELL